jgi:hypothetical protein
VTEDTKARTFADRVEAELGYEVDLAEELGEELGWFSLPLVLVHGDEEFEADVDFELSEEGIEILYAEIELELAETERRDLLHRIGKQLLITETHEEFRYEPTEEELAPLLADLDRIHDDVFA